jgi:hypothetical protein
VPALLKATADGSLKVAEVPAPSENGENTKTCPAIVETTPDATSIARMR